MKNKIVISIPSYNEEDTIGYVVKQIDLGLKKFYHPLNSLIVNVDSESEDNTRKVFLETKTLSPKRCLNTGKKPRGKGKNLIELFKFCNKINTNFVVVIDADIKSVKPEWVFLLLNPLIVQKFDYTVPVYARGYYDGNVTNNFAYPLTYAIFGTDLKQPIGGEFGLNRRLYKYLLKQSLNEDVLGFEIDIFMTYHAIGGGFKISEVYLGEKIHKPGFPSLMNKFLQIVRPAVEVSLIYKDKYSKVQPLKKYKGARLFKTKKRPNDKLVSAQLEQFSRVFKNNLSEYYDYLGNLTNKIVQVIVLDKNPVLSVDLWMEALARLLNTCYKKGFGKKLIPKICQLIAPIFFWRVVSFWEEIKYLNPAEVDKKITNQAELLRKKMITFNKNERVIY